MKIVLSEIYNFDYLHKYFFYTTFSFSKQELTFMIPNQLIPPAQGPLFLIFQVKPHPDL